MIGVWPVLPCGCAPAAEEFCPEMKRLRADVEQTRMLALAGHVSWDMHGEAHRRFEEHLGTAGPLLDIEDERTLGRLGEPWTALEYLSTIDRYLVGNSAGNVLLVSGYLHIKTQGRDIWDSEGPVRVPAKVEYVTLPHGIGYRRAPVEIRECTPMVWETVVPRECTVALGNGTVRKIRLGWGARSRKWCVWEER